MKIFRLEEYFGKYEFNAPYLLCCSDAETFSMNEIISMASPSDRALWDNLQLGYTEAKGMPLLRKQIAESMYPSLSQQQIICFAGAEDAIFCALYAICEPSDHVIVLTPCYQSLLEIPQAKNCSITTIPLLEGNDWRIDLNEINKAIKSNTKLVVINFPHNPTGQVITTDELKGLIKLLEAKGIWLLSDEVYRLLGKPLEPDDKPAAEIYSRALSVSVMSKAFGMAGLRIGWIACQDQEVLKKIEQMKHYTSICNSGPAEILSLIALKNKDQILKRNNEIVANNLALLDIFFKKYEDSFSWVRSQGGCVGFVKYKGKESVEKFCDLLVNDCGVLLMPASIYDYPSNHFRLGFGRKNMKVALDKLEEYLSR